MKFAFAVFVLLIASVSANKKVARAGVEVLVMGQSGKINIYPEGKTPAEGVAISFGALGERDSNGSVVGQAGPRKHNFNTFAQLDFTFSEVVETVFQNISAVTFSLTSYISSVEANFTSQVYLFKENGSYVWGNEETLVKAGTVKFNTKVEGWKFCGTPGYACREGDGSYLDSTICVKSKQKGNKTADRGSGPSGRDKPAQVELGDGIVMDIPKGVDKDGAQEDMPAGFPKLDNSGADTCFTFRFPKFSNYVLYDPSVSLDSSSSGGGDTASTTQSPDGATTGAPSSAVSLKWSLALVFAVLFSAWFQ